MNTLSKEYFDNIYRANTDPWQFETSAYEKAKYDQTINALTRTSYDEAFEIGCSIGVLTDLLADKAKKLLAVDVSEGPLLTAKKRLEEKPWVEIKQMRVPQEFPASSFNLIVVSEVGYYLSWPDLHMLQEKILRHLEPGAQLLLVHWLPKVEDYPLTGDEVHDSFHKLAATEGPLRILRSERSEKFRLDLFEKV